MVSNIDNFERFGWKFQNRVIQASLLDDKFFQQNVAILKDMYFGSDTHKTLWKIITEYYYKYNVAPTYDSIFTELALMSDEDHAVLCKKTMDEIKEETNQNELKHVKDTVTEFCTNKEVENAILDSVELLKNDQHDAIKSRIEQALKYIHVVDFGHDYFEKLEDRVKSNMRKTVPTGVSVLDHNDFLEGGLGVGEIGVIIAPTGGGKSFWLVQFGYGALKSNIDVVHYTFELSEVNIGKRYDACISGFAIKEIHNNYQEVDVALKKFNGGKLVIKEFPTRSANVNKIKFHLDRLRASGFNPGLVVIDYADLMLSTKSYEQKTWELEAIYEELRGFSMEEKVPVWTASQTNRSSIGEDIIGLDKIADAYAKAQVSDFMASFSRSQWDKENNKGKLYVAKNRIGLDGRVFEVDFDPRFSSISVHEIEVPAEDDTQTKLNRLWQKHNDEKGVTPRKGVIDGR